MSSCHGHNAPARSSPRLYCTFCLGNCPSPSVASPAPPWLCFECLCVSLYVSVLYFNSFMPLPFVLCVFDILPCDLHVHICGGMYTRLAMFLFVTVATDVASRAVVAPRVGRRNSILGSYNGCVQCRRVCGGSLCSRYIVRS